MWETKDTAPVEEDYSVKADQRRVQWRITAAFQALNHVTQVSPLPQGDLPWKQQRMAGKHWTSIIDFTARFYAVMLYEDSIMYTAFHIEGR